jgi:glycosyltransferase involved in cell wall biosynthesis
MAGGSVVISAVVCTLDRAAYLQRCLGSLQSQSLAGPLYEVLVVDNGSTDETRQVVTAAADRTANLRYLFESQKGLSRARNHGWQEARGRYVAYLDDDAVACPQWLERLVDAFETATPSPGCAGGRIELVWECPRPAWLSDTLLPSLGKIDWSDEPVFLSRAQWLGGGNIAFRKPLLQAIDGFPLALGRVGANLLSSEEILVRHQLEVRGYPCFYRPDASVLHHVHPSRVSRRWFLRRNYWQGISAAILQRLTEDLTGRQRAAAACRTLRHHVLSRQLLVDLVPPARDAEHFARLCGAMFRLGYMRGLVRRT